MSTITTCYRRTVVLLCLSFYTIALQAQTDQEAAMKAWMAYMTPGDMHALLAKGDGEWITEMTMWMDPQAQPIKSTGSCTNKMILGGRYQQSVYQGNIMGQNMEGIGTTGYDNAKKMFEGSWVDNMGSGMMKSTGTYDAATKTLHMKGMQTDPMSGKEIPFRETHQFIDDNTQVMEMFITPEGGPEFKTMEIKFTRKK